MTDQLTACRPASWYGTSLINGREEIGIYLSDGDQVVRYRLPVASAQQLGASVIEAIATCRHAGMSTQPSKEGANG